MFGNLSSSEEEEEAGLFEKFFGVESVGGRIVLSVFGLYYSAAGSCLHFGRNHVGGWLRLAHWELSSTARNEEFFNRKQSAF